MRETFGAAFGLLFAALFFILAMAGIGFGLDYAGLLYMPWRIHQETRIVRASNGYITAQQEMLRQFRLDYDAAGPEQRAGILRQMREIADRIPNDVQPDIAAFLGSR